MSTIIKQGLLLLAVVVAGIALTAPTPAGAQYQGCHATVSDVTVDPGQIISVGGSGSDPGADVTASITSVIGIGVADSNGNFAFSATIPADLTTGAHTLTISCGGADIAITLDVGRVPVGSVPLSATGSGSTIPLTRAAIAIVAAGGLAVALSHRRRVNAGPT